MKEELFPKKKCNDYLLSHLVKAMVLSVGMSLVFSVISCRNAETEHVTGTAEVKINFKGSNYEGIAELGMQASTGGSLQYQKFNQHQEIEMDNDFIVVADLIPQKTTSELQTAASNSNNFMAVTEPGLLPNDICYKLLVYDNNGNYVAERDYIRGKESNTAITPALMLDGGQTYTFVSYCVNTTSIASLPSVVNKNTLAGAVLSDMAGTTDLMYFKSSPITLQGGTNNYLDIVLKHMFSQITTTLDVSQTGYKIHTIDANIAPHYNKASVQLADGVISRSSLGSTPILFSLPTGNNIDLYPNSVSNINVVNNDTNNTTVFNIPSVRLGIGTSPSQGASIVNKNIKIENLKVTPGVKYKLNISLVPVDTYLTYMGLAAARINGQIWMRYNMGVTNMDPTANNPDQNPQVAALYGGYYFWGLKDPYTATNNTQKSGPAGAWNSGTNYAPVKNQTYDPCPAGYRVPTTNEWLKLLEYTTSENIGKWDTAPVDFGGSFGAGKVLRSKKNANVLITLPIAGIFHAAGHVDYRGYVGNYWTSTESGDVQVIKISAENPLPATSAIVTSISDKSFNQHSLRCIADVPN
ncbi:Fibrobacter succinogenes major domain (Fib_succ_major) [Elizabethkingia miricola]|nr:Fibrobacter succinogenes major domain (Fib_succ_major) [Elizabethkingia miricola]